MSARRRFFINNQFLVALGLTLNDARTTLCESRASRKKERSVAESKHFTSSWPVLSVAADLFIRYYQTFLPDYILFVYFIIKRDKSLIKIHTRTSVPPKYSNKLGVIRQKTKRFINMCITNYKTYKIILNHF